MINSKQCPIDPNQTSSLISSVMVSTVDRVNHFSHTVCARKAQDMEQTCLLVPNPEASAPVLQNYVVVCTFSNDIQFSDFLYPTLLYLRGRQHSLAFQ